MIFLLKPHPEGWRHVKVHSHGKDAFEKNLPTYAFDDPELKIHLENNGNYGVWPGPDHVIIETDISELTKLVLEKLPRTFTVLTPGHEGRHFYYNLTEPLPGPIPLLDKSRPVKEQSIGYIKTGNSYVVGPNSIHPNGKPYTIIDDSPIATISPEEIRRTFEPWITRRAAVAERREAHQYGVEDQPRILDFVNVTGFKQRGDTYQGPNPWHGSTTNANFKIDAVANTWFCFRCWSGGAGWLALAVNEHLLSCDEAVSGALRGELFLQTLQRARELGLAKPPRKGVKIWRWGSRID